MRPPLAILLCLIGLCPAACIAQQQHAQDARPPKYSLHEILVHLQENLSDYLSNVPDFFCDEHVVSDITLPKRKRTFRTTTDSIFRLRRSEESGQSGALRESREVKSVNGAISTGKRVQGPAVFTGAFSGALSVVSLEMSHCYDYTLESPGQLGDTPVVAVAYAIKPRALSDPTCPGPDKESGRAWIDPRTFHLLRIEMRTPNHRIDPDILVLWSWAVDYSPVTFDNRQFWMPKTISTRARANDMPVVWSFTANYSEYHKLTVTSHIITDIGDDPAPPPQ